jgi:uncharacterized protein YuzE
MTMKKRYGPAVMSVGMGSPGRRDRRSRYDRVLIAYVHATSPALHRDFTPCHTTWHAQLPNFPRDDRARRFAVTLHADRAPTSGATVEGSMRLTYDATTDVAYLSLRAVRRGEPLGPTLLVELDREFPGLVTLDFSLLDGRVVGLEFQMASACVPAELLATAERSDSRSLADRYQERVASRLAADLRVPGGHYRRGAKGVSH